MTETRTTKRQYANKIYPGPDEYETRSLAVEVPTLYAQALGLDTWGTGWHDSDGLTRIARINLLILSRREALLADALLQGLSGQEAWEWADQRGWEESGDWIWERAVHYGVDQSRIKPYPCGPEPAYHDHMASTGDVMGQGIMTRIDCPESECPTCTEVTA